ncbi:MAG TPA: 6-hydroxymethylpterin diphosphokinase MptE-like protein [Kofleriaceae bacterium]|nr:6-hydroxymethylpterin diphosphokinase MptE-like protein [Kofleriaceae bacterium]
MSLEVLETWRTLLGELGELGGALCDAIAADDVLGAIAATMQLRRARAAIARVEAPVQLRGDADELAAMAEVSSLTIGAHTAEAAMQRWLERPLPGDVELLASPLGAAVLADALLPAVWDFEADVVVLVGAGLEPVAEVLGSIGQRRIVILGGAGPAPGDALAVTSNDEAAIAVRMMVPMPPIRTAVRAALGVDPAQLDALVERLHGVLADLRIHRNTVCAFSRTWVEQGAANLPSLARWPSIAAVGERFAGLPMIIVAPGPSLARNVDQLHHARGKAIITAFSRSLKPVLAAGVVPDLVVTVDPQDVRYHFADCDLSRSCLVNAATVHPTLFELPAQRFMTMSANCTIDDWIFEAIGDAAVVPGGGSVATSALSLALAWGCDPIVFLGLDLSFPGGAYYVATSADGGARVEVDDRGAVRVGGWSEGFQAMKAGGGPATPVERAVELPGWAGGVVPSSFVFSMFHRWFVDRMRAVNRAGGPTVFNCTEGGAHIPGMDHLPFADVLARLDRELDISAELDAVAMTVDGGRHDRIIDHVTAFLRGVRRSRRLARVACRLVERGNTGPRLVAVERGLAAALAPLSFVSLLAQRELDHAHGVALRAGGEADYLAASAALFDTLIGVLDQIESTLRVALLRLGPRRSHGRAA